MTDRKISRKPTIAWRILTIALFLLVVPLLFQTFFLYNQEYEQKLADVKIDLELLLRERVILIEQQIRRDWDILDAIQGEKEVAKRLHVDTIPLPNGVPNHFTMASRSLNVFLVGVKKSPSEAAVISIPYTSLLEKHAGSYPIHLALIDQKGNSFADNGRPLQLKKGVLELQQPIRDTDFSLVLTVPEEAIEGLHKRDYIYRFATLLFFVGVLGGMAVYLLSRRVAKPLAHLCHTMERVSEGAVHARYQPDRMGFEINTLGLQFNETLDALLASTEAAEKERKARIQLAEKWKIGHEIQASLFPVSLPGFSSLEIGRGYLPAQEVNGDYYDLFHLENGQLLMAICDTAGKGISACLFSLGLRSILRSMATVHTDLSQIVLSANDLFWQDAKESSMFATVWLALYDPKTNTLTYCSQGHPPALLKRGNQILELATGGVALGAQELDAVDVKQISLQRGDLLLLYTDGIIEAHNREQELYGKKRLEEFLMDNQGACQQIAEALIGDVQQFCGQAQQHDDITFLLIRSQ